MLRFELLPFAVGRNVKCITCVPVPLLVEISSKSIGFLFLSIDCAGILKLRNADIELKKGETDIGRKNTRVRVVFRVAIPQSDGRMLWLQTASIPVECCKLMHHIYI